MVIFALLQLTTLSWMISPHKPSQGSRPSKLSHANFYMISPQQLGSFEPLPKRNVDSRPIVCCRNLLGSLTQFHDAWRLQRTILEQHLTTQLTEQEYINDELILLEHYPVYTLGTASDEAFVKLAGEVPVVRMDRGGEVTYHGPGQLTAYPILDLKRYKQDIHWYVRALEEVVILALGKCGLKAVREDGVTGVWIDGYKVAAIGIKCKRWVTQHGLAINVTPESLEHFGGIVPCGLEGRKVGCAQQFLNEGSSIDVETVAEYVKLAFEDVFQVRLSEH